MVDGRLLNCTLYIYTQAIMYYYSEHTMDSIYYSEHTMDSMLWSVGDNEVIKIH